MKNIRLNTLFAVLAITGATMFTACNKPAEDKAERMEDQAQETADEMQDAARETDTTAVQQ